MTATGASAAGMPEVDPARNDRGQCDLVQLGGRQLQRHPAASGVRWVRGCGAPPPSSSSRPASFSMPARWRRQRESGVVLQLASVPPSMTSPARSAVFHATVPGASAPNPPQRGRALIVRHECVGDSTLAVGEHEQRPLSLGARRSTATARRPSTHAAVALVTSRTKYVRSMPSEAPEMFRSATSRCCCRASPTQPIMGRTMSELSMTASMRLDHGSCHSVRRMRVLSGVAHPEFPTLASIVPLHHRAGDRHRPDPSP